MTQMVVDTANHIAAYAARAARVQVIAAYPITPQTSIVELIAELVEKGEFDAEYIRVESEHSALAACIGAAAGGVRTFTATSAHGLTLMHEALHWTSGSRLPIVMPVVNRTMGPGWNIWADLTDSMSQRDTGWIQFYCANNQEVFDTIIQAYRLCEDKRILLPAMVCLEAFILSHTYMPVKIPDQEKIDEFLPSYEPKWFLDIDNPLSHGNIITPEWYMELRHMMQESMENAKALIPEIDREYERYFGSRHGGLIEKFRCEDADLILLTMGTIGSEAKVAVGHLRNEGLKVGSARIRVFRPFPAEEIRELTKNTQMLATIDRGISFGMEGFLAEETKASLCGHQPQLLIAGFIAGLGGRDVTFKTIEKIARKSMKWLGEHKVEEEITWVDLRP